MFAQRSVLPSITIIMLGLSMIQTSMAQDTVSKENNQVVDGYVAKWFDATSGVRLPYRFYGASAHDGERLPLVIFLHGAGERGDDNLKQLKHGAKEFSASAFQKAHPCFVIAPQCAEEQKWVDHDWDVQEVKQPEAISKHLSATIELIEKVAQEFPIDRSRIYITGLSMGGYGTWDAIARYPTMFAAAVPICGGADVDTATKLNQTPVWNFHGAADPVVSVDLSRRIIAAMEQAGGHPKYTEYPGVAHDSWTQTYQRSELFEWLFAQKREPQ